MNLPLDIWKRGASSEATAGCSLSWFSMGSSPLAICNESVLRVSGKTIIVPYFKRGRHHITPPLCLENLTRIVRSDKPRCDKSEKPAKAGGHPP